MIFSFGTIFYNHSAFCDACIKTLSDKSTMYSVIFKLRSQRPCETNRKYNI